MSEATTKSPRKAVSKEQFARVWIGVVKGESPSYEAVAEQTGLTVNTVKQKSSKFRTEYGIPLPVMPRGKSDNSAVQKLVAELLAGETESAPQDGESAPQDESTTQPEA